MITKNKKIIGSVLIIPIADNEFYYGRIIEDYVFVFYDYKSAIPNHNLEYIISHDILFAVLVNFQAIRTGDWEIIGKMELDDRHKKAPIFFQADFFNRNFYKNNLQSLEKTLRCKTFESGGLQDGGIYSYENIKDRLVAYFNGKEYNGIKSKIEMLHQLQGRKIINFYPLLSVLFI
jgi:hypothetical protein